MFPTSKKKPASNRRVLSRVVCALLIGFALCHSLASQSATVKAVKKVDGKETTVFTIKSGVLPSSGRLEVISQELPWAEEILFRFEADERPVPGFKCIVRRFYVDLFSVIRPSNAP